MRLHIIFIMDRFTYEAFVDGVAYGGREYVEHPEAFGVPERNVAYVQSTRKPVDDIIAFLSEHEEELDSLDIVAGGYSAISKN